jgi:hypothetical protein
MGLENLERTGIKDGFTPTPDVEAKAGFAFALAVGIGIGVTNPGPEHYKVHVRKLC